METRREVEHWYSKIFKANGSEWPVTINTVRQLTAWIPGLRPLLVTPVKLMTHIVWIRGVFDVANSQRYRAGFAPMLFQWSHAHIARFFVAKNRTIKRGLERKNRTIKKSCYVCHGTNRVHVIHGHLHWGVQCHWSGQGILATLEEILFGFTQTVILLQKW